MGSFFPSSSNGGGGEREGKRLRAHSPFFFSPRLLGALPRNNKEAEEERRREGKRSDQDDDVDASFPPPPISLSTPSYYFSPRPPIFSGGAFSPSPSPLPLSSPPCIALVSKARRLFLRVGSFLPPAEALFWQSFSLSFPIACFGFRRWVACREGETGTEQMSPIAY